MACILLPVANFRFECVCGKVEWGGGGGCNGMLPPFFLGCLCFQFQTITPPSKHTFSFFFFFEFPFSLFFSLFLFFFNLLVGI